MTARSDIAGSAAAVVLPPQAISVEVLREKYAKGDERSVADVQRRVARALARPEPPAQRKRRGAEFVQALEGGFVPAGRIHSAARSTDAS
jgi:ribonucleoside-diphosphate reductase alpha chain